jgi:hypothetical protein
MISFGFLFSSLCFGSLNFSRRDFGRDQLRQLREPVEQFIVFLLCCCVLGVDRQPAASARRRKLIIPAI